MRPIDKTDQIYSDYESILEPGEEIFKVLRLQYDASETQMAFYIGLLGALACVIVYIFLMIFIPITGLLIIIPFFLPSLIIMIIGMSRIGLAKSMQKIPFLYTLTTEKLIVEEKRKTYLIPYKNIKVIAQKHQKLDFYHLIFQLNKPITLPLTKYRGSYSHQIPFIPNSTNFYNTLVELTSEYSDIRFKQQPFKLYSKIFNIIFPGLFLSIATFVVGSMGLFSSP